jgi:hypothetical protein
MIAAAAALLGTAVLGLAISFGAIRLPSLPVTYDRGVDPAVIDAGREWQRQREQQGGFSDPFTEAGREWQRQREQQGGFTSAD